MSYQNPKVRKQGLCTKHWNSKNQKWTYERAYKLQTAQFAQSRCAMRATQGAQCAQPKVRNVMQCAGSRRVMCTTNVLPIAQQDGSGWQQNIFILRTKYFATYGSAEIESALQKSLSHEHVGVNMWLMGRLVTHTGGTHRWAKGWTNSEQMERTLWLWCFC